MRHDRFTELIRETDKVAGQPTYAPVDVKELRRRVEQRRQYQMMGVIMTMLLMGLGVTFWVVGNPPPKSSAISTLADLQAQTEALSVTVNRLCEANLHISRLSRRRERVAQLEARLEVMNDPLEMVKTEVDQAARTLMISADTLSREPGLRQQAIRDYEQVIRLFPDNTWAQVARNRLIRMKTKKDIQKGDLL